MKILKVLIPIFFFSLILNSCQQSYNADEQDWVQYKYDNYRSGVSNTKIDLSNIDLDWVYQSSQYPVPAWYGPANEDAFANSGPLPSMRDYDLAYYPIIVDDKLYFGSTSDDGIHCLDNKTGKEIWNFTTNGPIHNAPVYDQGKLYFGSDDGCVYCIDARSAKLEWKFSPSPKGSPLVLNNNRLISFWPIRTGVTIENNRVYFGASLLPWKQSYLCSINKKTGKVDGEGCYVREYENMTFEGSMATTGNKIIQPQGRIAPAFFEKSTGESLGLLPGSGGCFVLVTKEENIIHSKTSRNKTMQELSKSNNPDFMTFNGGKEIIVKGDTSFVLTDNSISAYHRTTKKLIWLRRDFFAHRMIIAGDYLFAGSTDKVFGINLQNGLPLWEAEVKGTVYALAAANEALYASTGEGLIYCFSSGNKTNNLFVENLSKLASIDPITESTTKEIAKESANVLVGPFIEAISRDSVKVSFQLKEKANCSIKWTSPGSKAITVESRNKLMHEFKLSVRKDFKYSGVINLSYDNSFSFEYDNFFNFSKQRKVIPLPAELPMQTLRLVKQALTGPKKAKGLCLVLGTDDQNIPLLIARNSKHDIVVLDPSDRKISKLRKFLKEYRLYGIPISAYSLSDVNLNLINTDLASLIWVQNAQEYLVDDIIKHIAPLGKAIIYGIDEEDDWIGESILLWQVRADYIDNALVLTKLSIENQGEWTHQYARPDNSAFGGESLWGSTSTAEFDVQWMGRPGPRFQTDRSGRKPSPLSVSGKLFVQGNERVVALDVYNGANYWSKGFPGFIRMNIHRDCSNWAADDSRLYMAIRNKLLIHDQETGELVNIISADPSPDYDWGYIAVLEDKIIGSTTPVGSHYTNYHGGEGWYDWAEGPMAEKVISKSIFARSKTNNDLIWKYSLSGAIINSTITIEGEHIYFVESRTPGLRLSDSDRGQDDLFKSIYLISLDHKSGNKEWEKKLDNHPGKTTYFMAAGNGKIVILSSADSEYHLYTYELKDGNLVWTDKMPWFHSNHGGHLSRPAIVGNKLVVKPAIYQLDSGSRIDYNVPKSGHGCASYALTEQSIFYRGGSVTQFNFDTREFSRWERLRPDCWISTIPAQGMILSPEAGGGCSCGNWLETSMVMAPVSRAPITIERKGEEHLIDFKDETYGDYYQKYLPNEFRDEIDIEIKIKPNIQADIYYTLDGSEPTLNSTKYIGPVNVSKSTELKAVVFVQSEEGKRQYFRSKQFSKIEVDINE